VETKATRRVPSPAMVEREEAKHRKNPLLSAFGSVKRRKGTIRRKGGTKELGESTE